MPPIKDRNDHQWTSFEMHTLLCMLARDQHIDSRSSFSSKQNIYVSFATELNNTVHRDDYAKDIPKKEVARMIDRVLRERRGVLGQGGLAERGTAGRVTRGVRMAWNRTPAVDFDGTVTEWNNGRKEKVMRAYGVRRGIVKEDSKPASSSDRNDNTGVSSPQATPLSEDQIWAQAAAAKDITPSLHPTTSSFLLTPPPTNLNSDIGKLIPASKGGFGMFSTLPERDLAIDEGNRRDRCFESYVVKRKAKGEKRGKKGKGILELSREMVEDSGEDGDVEMGGVSVGEGGDDQKFVRGVELEDPFLVVSEVEGGK